jgi:hypothetical protein
MQPAPLYQVVVLLARQPNKDNDDVAVLQAQEPEKQGLCATPTCLTGLSVSPQPLPNIATLHARCTCSRISFLLMAFLDLSHL